MAMIVKIIYIGVCVAAIQLLGGCEFLSDIVCEGDGEYVITNGLCEPVDREQPVPACACANGTAATTEACASGEEQCIQCDDGYSLDESICRQIYTYTCAHGEAATGATFDADDQSLCTACNEDYALLDGQCVARTESVFPCMCANGTADAMNTCANGEQRCAECADGYALDGSTCRQSYAYTCAHGEATGGITFQADQQQCTACNEDYALLDGQCIVSTELVFPCMCANGTAAATDACASNEQRCAECADGYALDEATCRQSYAYTCAHGDAAIGATFDADQQSRCAACNEDYALLDGECIARTESVFPCMCANGTADAMNTCANGEQRCAECADGYALDEATCRQSYAYTCEHGEAATGTTFDADQQQCAACDFGYTLEGNGCYAHPAYTLAGDLIDEITTPHDLSQLDGDGDSSIFLPNTEIASADVTWEYVSSNTERALPAVRVRNDHFAAILFGPQAVDGVLRVTVAYAGASYSREIDVTVPAGQTMSRSIPDIGNRHYVLAVHDQFNGTALNEALWGVPRWKANDRRDEVVEARDGYMHLKTRPAVGDLQDASGGIILGYTIGPKSYTKVRMRMAKYVGKVTSVYFFPHNTRLLASTDSTLGMEMDALEYRYKAYGDDRCYYQNAQHMFWQQMYTHEGQTGTINRASVHQKRDYAASNVRCGYAYNDTFLNIEHTWDPAVIHSSVVTDEPDGSTPLTRSGYLYQHVTPICRNVRTNSEGIPTTIFHVAKRNGECGVGDLSYYPEEITFPSVPQIPHKLTIAASLSGWGGYDYASTADKHDEAIVDYVEVWIESDALNSSVDSYWK